jgi:hypothetical protein
MGRLRKSRDKNKQTNLDFDGLSCRLISVEKRVSIETETIQKRVKITTENGTGYPRIVKKTIMYA